MTMTRSKQLVFAGLCAAIGVALPLAFHTIPNAGSIFLPMHIPVLICGFLCGPAYGLLCGIVTPIVSSLATGMPPAAILPGMVCELATYGLMTGLLFRLLRGRARGARIYLTLIGAMLCGRLVSGALNALIFRAGKYSLQVWLTASFVTALPGIILQLALIPVLLLALERARLISLS